MCDAIMSLHVQHRIAMMLNEAAVWRMPLALGVAHYNGSSAFKELVMTYRDVLFMFWAPSVEFIEISPVFVRFPNFNFTQWYNGIMASTRQGEYPRHVVSNELMAMAPDARVMLQRMKLSSEEPHGKSSVEHLLHCSLENMDINRI